MTSGNVVEMGVKVLRLAVESNVRRSEKSKYPLTPLLMSGGIIMIVPFYPGDPEHGLIPLAKNRGFIDHLRGEVKILEESARAVGLEPTELMELVGDAVDIPGVKKVDIKKIYTKSGVFKELSERFNKRHEQFKKRRLLERKEE